VLPTPLPPWRGVLRLITLLAFCLRGEGCCGLSLCSPNAGATPSAEDYIRWLTLEVGCLPEVFMSDNENFVSTAIEGVLAMVGEADSIDLESLRAVAIACRADILPGERDVARSRWRPSGY
jgi:hypothetical protein